jgi:hypothetical protein
MPGEDQRNTLITEPMTADDMRNTVIVEMHDQVRRTDLQTPSPACSAAATCPDWVSRTRRSDAG